MTTTYRPVRMMYQRETYWAVETCKPGQQNLPHGHYSSQAEAQAECDRLAAQDDEATKTGGAAP
jgi:hypothetical protein